MSASWNRGVRGKQVLPLINLDADTIRVEAGPGTGKTFGLVRRVERLLHPDGVGADGREVLIVAFNRVIAKQLRKDIDARLKTFNPKHGPIVRTIHALCVDVIGEDLRMLLPHEREAMIYDVLQDYPAVAAKYDGYYEAAQALRDHEARHAKHMQLWKATRGWLDRHQAHLVSDLPPLLLERLKGGDFPEESYPYVIVDEFQDLTPGEQELMFKLRSPGGQLVALGDPRQSIYAFRGNDRQGLDKLDELVAKNGAGSVIDVAITECQRCPKTIVLAANELMSLSGVDEMIPVSDTQPNLHLVTWASPQAEAAGMADAIVKNVHAHPEDRHLAMVTRRDFGYRLRDEIAKLDAKLHVDLGFSEGLLESWSAREAFLLFCLLIDPDRPTWRAWLAYKNSSTGKDFKATKRNADAYLRLLQKSKDVITETVIEGLADEPRKQPRGEGGSTIWDRADRFLDLREQLAWEGENAAAFANDVFNTTRWIGDDYEDANSATMDLQLLRQRTGAFLIEQQERRPKDAAIQHLRAVARRLRHQIATNEPLATGESADLEVTTLWGAKGVTAEHVYMLGVCREAIPGQRREDYPGTEAEYVEEQRRLFYVSITRAKKTLVLSRALKVRRGEAERLGLKITTGNKYWGDLKMSPFLHEIIALLPDAVPGADWAGCV